MSVRVLRVSWAPPAGAAVYSYRLRVTSQSTLSLHLGSDVTHLDVETTLPAAIVSSAEFLRRYQNEVHVDALTSRGDVAVPVAVAVLMPGATAPESFRPRLPAAGLFLGPWQDDEGGGTA